MSGQPHGLEGDARKHAPPHGDALLPNRTGGGMTLRITEHREGS